MYKVIKIANKEYRFEFSIEASLYADCAEKIVHFFDKMSAVNNINVDGLSEEEAKKKIENASNAAIKGMADIPSVAMTLWYAGMLEHHGPEGDRTVLTLRDAKELYKQYRLENPENSTFYDIVALSIEQMGEDGFFGLIGLDKLTTPSAEESGQPKKTTKKAKVTQIS